VSKIPACADVFHAVSDQTRRKILDRLSRGEATVSEIVSAFDISQPSISEHLRILREAGLVSAKQDGRRRIYSLRAQPLREVADWVVAYGRFWDAKLGALGKYLEKQRGKDPA
jgi:DNA-binding transcriptional ArsR family regulator